MAEHTSGPWTYWVWGGAAPKEKHGIPSTFGVAEDDDRDDSGYEIGMFTEDEIPPGEQLANARLIAAAPSLFAAAEAALKNETYARLTGFGNMPDDLFAALTAAIAEARGTNRKDSTQ